MKKIILIILTIIILVLPNGSVVYGYENTQKISVNINNNNDEYTIDEYYSNLRRITENKITRFIPLEKEERINIKEVICVIDQKGMMNITDDKDEENFYEVVRGEDGAYINLYIKEYDKVSSIALNYNKKSTYIKGSDLVYSKLSVYDNSKNTIKIDTIDVIIEDVERALGVWQEEKKEFSSKVNEYSLVIKRGMDFEGKINLIIAYNPLLGSFNKIPSNNEEYIEKFNKDYGNNILKQENTLKKEEIRSDEGMVWRILALIILGLLLGGAYKYINWKARDNNTSAKFGIKKVKEIPSKIEPSFIWVFSNTKIEWVLSLLLIELISNDEIMVQNDEIIINEEDNEIPVPRRYMYENLKDISINNRIPLAQLEKIWSEEYFEIVIEKVIEDYKKFLSEGNEALFYEQIMENKGLNNIKWMGFKKYLSEISEKEIITHKMKELEWIAKYSIALGSVKKGNQVHELLNPNTLMAIDFYNKTLVKVKGNRYLIDYIIFDLKLGGRK